MQKASLQMNQHEINVKKNYIISRERHTEQRLIVVCKKRREKTLRRKYNRITVWRSRKKVCVTFHISTYAKMREKWFI